METFSFIYKILDVVKIWKSLSSESSEDPNKKALLFLNRIMQEFVQQRWAASINEQRKLDNVKNLQTILSNK